MKPLVLFILILVPLFSVTAKEITVQSPDRRLAVTLNAGEKLGLSARDGSTLLFSLPSLGLVIRGEVPFGARAAVKGTSRRAQDTVIYPAVRERAVSLRERYNEAAVTFQGGYGIIIRVYDEGVAYRLVTSLDRPIVVEQEELALTFPESTSVIWQPNAEFWSAYEYPYRISAVREMATDSMSTLPLLALLPRGQRIVMTEAHIEEYPGLWIRHEGKGTLRGTFPGYPLELLETKDHYQRGRVTKYAPEIARTRGTRSYPWRVFAVGRSDADLLTNSLVYLLGEPSRLVDASWVQPGLVTLDWWARRNLFGVDFQGDVNTATAKYMIDFAAHYGLGYFLLDCGWTKEDDLLSINPSLDMEEVIAYAKAKNVRMLLWAVWTTLEKQWDAAFEQFSRWNIAGIKVDFMNRDDQEMVKYYYRLAEETARRKMLLMYHGAYKPDGLRRTFPNVITREGLIEFEQNQVNMSDSPEYHTLLPFIRMVAGPADYLPGTIRNAQQHEFKMIMNRPMGQGTRAHTMALCVVLESPMRMFPDAPSDYYLDDVCMRFMAEIPTTWDELRVLHAKAGEYIALARRNGDTWYVAAITDWESREMQIDCSFLTAGKSYELTAIQDGVNANLRAIDFKKTAAKAERNSRLDIRLAKGGGWVGRFAVVR